MNAVIELKNVVREYKHNTGLIVRALDHIDLTIRQGEFIGIIGPNGSGKTTMARLLNGLLLPTCGKVLINGLDTFNPNQIKEIRRLVGMVFQNPDNQIISPVVEEEVAFGAENLNLSPAEVGRRVDWALKATGLYDLRKFAPHLLSGGQKQRLAVAAAMAMMPSYLVLDEPTSMLDQIGRYELTKYLEELRQEQHISIIMISHYMEDVASADRLIVLHEGRVYLDGPPWEVFQSPRFDLIDLKPPPIARLNGIMLRQGHQIDKTIITLERMVEFLCR